MATREFQYGVYIGRFQPLHVGHEAVIREALTKVDTLIVAIGSVGLAPSPINPFTFEQREEIFRSVFRHEITAGRLLIIPVEDYGSNSSWAAQVRNMVNIAILAHANPNKNFSPVGLKDVKIALAGYGKDASSFYLSMFPDWASIQIQTQHGTINASDIRHDYLRRLPRMPRDAVSEPVLAALQSFSLTEQFKNLAADATYYREYPAQWGKGPFLTADAFITHGDEILLIRRGRVPGRGLLALPGGFLEPHERFYEAGLREAEEETGIDREDLESYYEGFHVEDNPKRSLRGRIVTGVSIFQIPKTEPRPEPVAGDDAAEAGWFFFPALSREDFFEDHYDLIRSIYNPE